MKTTEQLQELLSVAENAYTQDRWHVVGGKLTLPDEWGVGSGTNANPDVAQMLWREDAAHIAAFDPTTCREMVRRLISAERELTEIRACDKCGLCEDHHE